jgi:hypothetical protein
MRPLKAVFETLPQIQRESFHSPNLPNLQKTVGNASKPTKAGEIYLDFYLESGRINFLVL